MFTEHATYFYSRNSLLTIILAILLLLCFKDIKLKSIKFVNYFASLAFGIYLIHDNYYVRIWMYDNLFHCKELAESNLLLPFILVCSFIITFICMIFEALRMYIFDLVYCYIKNYGRQNKCNNTHVQ